MGDIFQTIFYQPLLNALVFFYSFFPWRDFGLAVILLTLVLRIVLYPLSARAFRAQKTLSDLQPKVQEIQEKFKHNKEELSRKMLELYQKEHINPFAAFLPLLIQFPVLIALFQVFRQGVGADQLPLLYSFISQPGVIETSFLGFVDLSQKSIPIAFLAGISQYIQGKQAFASNPQKLHSSKPDLGKAIQTQMLYGLPVITVFFTSQLPSALGLYWIASNVFSIWQQWYLIKKHQKAEQTQ